MLVNVYLPTSVLGDVSVISSWSNANDTIFPMVPTLRSFCRLLSAVRLSALVNHLATIVAVQAANVTTILSMLLPSNVLSKILALVAVIAVFSIKSLVTLNVVPTH